MSATDPSLLILIPAYNEEGRIGPVLLEYITYFRSNYRGTFSVVVVLNGCRDNTLGIVQKAAQEFPEIRPLEFPAPIGKGGALIEGFKLAPQAELIGYVDADGATGPKAFLELVRILIRDSELSGPKSSPVDCVIGSRWLPGAVLHQSQTWMRRFTSRCFHAVVQSLFWMGIEDTQCPAKVVTRRAAEKVNPMLRIADLAFDVNLLVALSRAGFKIQEIPTEWTDKIGSKVTQTLMRTSLVMFLSVVRLRLVYSPFYERLRFLRPLETWLYRKLKAPPPLPRPENTKPGTGITKR